MPAASRTAQAIYLGAIAMIAVPSHDALTEEPPAYCPMLRDVAALVRTKDRFTSIIGRPREGNFLATTLPLPGWADCWFYGTRTYACDSRPLASPDAAATAFAKTLGEVKGCLRDHWAEDPSRASLDYAVIHDDRQVASITISVDHTDKNEHVLRLILFLRSR